MGILSFFMTLGDVPRGIIVILTFITTIATQASMWVIFVKAGLPGWVSLIPIVNNYYLFEIATGEGFSCFLLFLPIISWIVYVKMLYCLQEAFGASGSFYWGLLLLPGIFFPLLAFSRTYYNGPYRDFI
ncbi:MAG TPA: DUF5684 domain-containing protein [Saccharofermentans sp.]|nr:DUF5684 domain-containing protein [Saccharofermentans sp.]